MPEGGDWTFSSSLNGCILVSFFFTQLISTNSFTLCSPHYSQIRDSPCTLLPFVIESVYGTIWWRPPLPYSLWEAPIAGQAEGGQWWGRHWACHQGACPITERKKNRWIKCFGGCDHSTHDARDGAEDSKFPLGRKHFRWRYGHKQRWRHAQVCGHCKQLVIPRASGLCHGVKRGEARGKAVSRSSMP